MSRRMLPILSILLTVAIIVSALVACTRGLDDGIVAGFDPNIISGADEVPGGAGDRTADDVVENFGDEDGCDAKSTVGTAAASTAADSAAAQNETAADSAAVQNETAADSTAVQNDTTADSATAQNDTAAYPAGAQSETSVSIKNIRSNDDETAETSGSDSYNNKNITANAGKIYPDTAPNEPTSVNAATTWWLKFIDFIGNKGNKGNNGGGSAGDGGGGGSNGGATTGVSALAEYVRKKYNQADPYTYTEPIYEIPYNAKIAYAGEFIKQSHWLEGFRQYIDENIHIYNSSDFSEFSEVQCIIEINNLDGELTLSPYVPAFSIERDKNAAATASAGAGRATDWGNAPKYYIVRNIDIDTGEMLAKPIVTFFTVKADLESPRLKFRIDEQGKLLFYWNSIEGADYYSIGQVFLDAGNNGKVYSNFMRIEDVADSEWRKIGDVKSLSKEIEGIDVSSTAEWYMESAYKQNMSLADFSTFFSRDIGIAAIAINKDGNSSISNIVPFSEFASMTPHKPENSLNGRYYRGDGSLTLRQSGDSIKVSSLSAAPVYQSIEMLDGTYKMFVIDYPDSLDGVDEYQGQDRLITGTHGTMFKNGIIVADTEGRTMPEALAYLNAREDNALRAAGGIAYSDIALEDIPGEGMESNLGNDGDESGAGDEGDGSGGGKAATPGPPGSSIGNEGSSPYPSEGGDGSGDSTEDGAAATDAAILPKPRYVGGRSNMSGIDPQEMIYFELYDIYANSALSAYIAYNFINHIEAITLRDFPEAADGEVLVDAILEAYYQNNHYIGGIEMNYMLYDYATRTLTVPYVMTADEHKRLKSDVDAKANEIVAQIITEGMSDYEKEEAINNYICENAEYDYDALYAMARLFNSRIISDKYKYTQTAFGVINNNRGICQAYAEAFNLLAAKAGLHSVVVTGVLNGAGGHAWNRVLIDGQWFSLDVLSNDSEEYFNEYLNMPDEVAASFVTENNKYVLDRMLPQFTADAYGYDYFSRNGMSTSLAGLENYLADKLAAGVNVDVYINDYQNITEEELAEALNHAAQTAGVTLRTQMLLWILRISCE